MPLPFLTSVKDMPAIDPALPPATQSALRELQRALTEPANLGDKWPFADPPAVAEAAAKRGRGRPPTVKPHQVVMLARFLRLGETLTAAAARAKLTVGTASDLAAGRHSVCAHRAVTAAGVEFPMPRGEKAALQAAGEGGVHPTPYPPTDRASEGATVATEIGSRAEAPVAKSPQPRNRANPATPEASA